VVFLILGSLSNVVGYQTQYAEKPISASRGTWLYVGGSGPGNYTRIQDAIDDGTSGDTVFVYDDSSPYVENIVINTSISLLGEDKNTTIINGTTNDFNMNLTVNIGVYITADKVTVRGFTIQSCNLTGIGINSNNNSITDNILSDDYIGIGIGYYAPDQSSSQMTSFNMIINNFFIRDTGGIYVAGGEDNIIQGNVFSQTGNGITVSMSMSTNISHNVISEGFTGVFILGSYDTVLYRNNITYNEYIGVYTAFTSSDRILQNNFIGNNKSAVSTQILLLKIQLFKKELNLPIRRNVWNGNYWDGPRSLPYKIPGFFKFRFQVDWHPAQEPHDIPVMS
jgi:parallel beta-helix repeat protein